MSRLGAIAELLDIVKLRVASGRWAAGQLGTVVEILPVRVLVELADETGRTLDLVELPHDAVTVVTRPKQEHLAI